MKKLGNDMIWDAIPLEDLVDLAVKRSKECGLKSKEEIIVCATEIVKKELCPCVSKEKLIVEAVVDEFYKKVTQK